MCNDVSSYITRYTVKDEDKATAKEIWPRLNEDTQQIQLCGGCKLQLFDKFKKPRSTDLKKEKSRSTGADKRKGHEKGDTEEYSGVEETDRNNEDRDKPVSIYPPRVLLFFTNLLFFSIFLLNAKEKWTLHTCMMKV